MTAGIIGSDEILAILGIPGCPDKGEELMTAVLIGGANGTGVPFLFMIVPGAASSACS